MHDAMGKTKCLMHDTTVTVINSFFFGLFSTGFGTLMISYLFRLSLDVVGELLDGGGDGEHAAPPVTVLFVILHV